MTVPPIGDSGLELIRLQSIVDGNSDCIKVLDLEGHLLSMNEGGLETMEIGDFQQCQFLLWPTFWEGEARLQVEQAISAARNGQTTTFEGPANTFAGTPRWWEVRVSPIRARDGTITQLLAISRDVTTRKTAELKLLESEQLLNDLARRLKLQVSQNELALEAFVRFTTVVASSTDLKVLATAATEILRDAVGGAVSGFYLVRGDRAYPLVFSENTPEDVVAARRSGLPLDAPLVVAALAQRAVAFAEGEQAQSQSVGYASALSMTAYQVLGEPYALLATGTPQPRWTDQERAIIESVGQGLGLALERVHQTQQLQERTAGLDAFVSFTEVSGSTSDVLELARRAVEVLRSNLGEVSVAYYERDQNLWTARVWSENFTPEVAAVLAAGIPVTAPSYSEAVETKRVVFVSGWDAAAQGVALTEQYGAGAFYPCMVADRPLGLLAIGVQRAGDWTAREQAVFSAVGRSLTLALERADLLGQLEQRSHKIAEDARAQEAFVAFTEAVGAESDVLALACQATQVIQTTLSEVSVVYYEREQRHWIGKIWTDDVSPAVAEQLRAGVPLEAPRFAQAVQAGTPVFADSWDAEGNHLSEATMYGAAAFVPILVDGEAHRLLAVGKFRNLAWTEREQAIVRAVGRGLGLALERTERARQLIRQRDVLEERTRDLEAANEELEAFTYSASHDLRTPVRHVMGFAELTQLALLKTPNPQAEERLEVVKQAALRMSAMIDGMLALSRSGRSDLHAKWVDLGALVTQARRDAAVEFPAHPVRWQIEQLPTVWGDRDLLQQVLTNLMSNAVKYSSTRPVSEIRVWTTEDAHAWTVSVQDNGVGFDPKYAQKLFGIFQRLHTERQFKGTGIGLATVRRIVVKHGGQVGVESAVDVGATFSFSLPKPKPS